ncbi:MAG TPA: hypothetical protein VI138_05600 [Candidatus Dormibacteraeota bacterium]
MGKRLLGLSLLLGSALVLTLSGAGSPLVLSQKQALSVVRQYSKVEYKASSTFSTGLQNTVEEGIEAEQDDSNFSLLTEAGTAPSNPSSPVAVNSSTVTIYLGTSTKAPAEFLVLMDGPDDSYTWYGIFRKDSKKAPWRVEAGDGVPPGTTTASLTPTAGPVAVKVNAAGSELPLLVHYLSTGKGNVAPSPNASDWYTTDQQTVAADAQGGVNLAVKYSADKSPVSLVKVSGGTLELGGLDEVSTETAGSGQCVYATNGNTSEYLTLVPTGIQYQEIQVRTLVQVMLFVPNNSSQPVQLLSYYAQLMSASTPACN